MENILSFKGFNKDLQCRGFQYEVGKGYEQLDKIECCKNGFHACKFPTDVFNYYPPINGTRYCTVIQSGDLDSDTMSGDSKIASSTIYIESEISTEQLIEAGVNNILKDASKYIKDATYRNCCSESGNTTIINNNYAGAAINMGSYSAAINNKANSIIASTNEHSVVVNKGSESVVGTTENNSIIYNTKEGDSSICSSTGNNSIIRSTALNDWIVLREYYMCGIIKEVKAFRVDGEKIKADTFYKLKDGEAVEVDLKF